MLILPLCPRTAIWSSTGCRTASVKSATTATRSSRRSGAVTTVDCAARSSAAAAATRKFLASSWATRVSAVGVFCGERGSEPPGMWTWPLYKRLLSRTGGFRDSRSNFRRKTAYSMLLMFAVIWSVFGWVVVWLTLQCAQHVVLLFLYVL